MKIPCRCCAVWLPTIQTMSSPAFSIGNSGRLRTADKFTAGQVSNLRRYHNIPRFEPATESPSGEVLPIQKAAKVLGVAASTLHRWLNAGFVAGEQLTPGAP